MTDSSPGFPGYVLQVPPDNLSAAVVWAVAYSLVGYVSGQYWDELLAVARSLGYGVIFLAALALLADLLRRRWSRNHLR